MDENFAPHPRSEELTCFVALENSSSDPNSDLKSLLGKWTQTGIIRAMTKHSMACCVHETQRPGSTDQAHNSDVLQHGCCGLLHKAKPAETHSVTMLTHTVFHFWVKS